MKILILGFGNMGKWFVQCFSAEHDVYVWEQNFSLDENSTGCNILSDLEEVKNIEPDYVINAASLHNTILAFDAVLPYLKKNSVLVDIASVKTGLKEYYSAKNVKFVSTHPMFGPTFGNMNALKNENAIIISESDSEGKGFLKEFFSSLNLKIHEYSFEEHDKTTAWSLTTPFVSSLVFAACMKKQDAPGTTFKKHHQIAKGLLNEDNSLLSEILFNPYSIRQIENINSQLRYLTHIIKDRDTGEMVKFLDKLRKNL